jgi:hypothetical protein
LLFPANFCGFPSDTGPRFLAIPGSSSPELHPLFRVLNHFAPARHPQASDASLEVTLSPSRHWYAESTHQLLSQASLRSALSVSHTLDGLLLSILWRLISSPYHVRDSLFRGLLPTASRLNSSPSLLPSCRFPRSPAVGLPHLHQIAKLVFRVLIQLPIRCH